MDNQCSYKKLVVSVIVLLAANLLFFFTLWISNRYADIHLDQLLYQLQSSLSGTSKTLTGSAVVRVVGFAVIATAAGILLYYLLSGRLQRRLVNHRLYCRYCGGKACSFFKIHALMLSVALLMISAVIFILRLEVLAFVGNTVTDSDFIETHYVSPEETVLSFPEEKRNLIYIFLESMESTYSDTSVGSPILDDYIPELTALARDNISFSHTDGIGGAYSYSGTTWTAASLVAQTSGLPVKVTLGTDSYNGENEYMPGVISLGDILAKEGYRQVFLLGSDSEFASRDSYFTEHGNYEIIDLNVLKEEGRLPADYMEWWGYEDSKLFEFAKETLTELAASGDVFNFTMLTADTHFPDGYLCTHCTNTYSEQYANVLACSSRQISEFLAWIAEQPFYENTTIILSGDHLTMDPKFLEELSESYVRTIYNCILNAPVSAEKTKCRQFGVVDMFPTTLAALGVEIEGDRLGLGTNLFSDKETLTEQLGYEVLEAELLKNSEFYNTVFLHEE